MLGLICPGGWEEFFRFIGEPYAKPMWPLSDDRKIFEVLIPKLKAASEKFDMVPCPQHKQFGPQEWGSSEGETENRLPGKTEAYFLKNAEGPAFEVGGTVCRPLCTTEESGGKFSIGCIESSSHYHAHGIFAKEGQCLRFDNAHHAFMVAEGSVEFHLDSSAPSKLGASEVIYVPKGTAFRFRATSRFSKMYAFASGGGLVEVLCSLGKEYKAPILPGDAESADVEALEALGPRFGFSVW